MIGRTASELKSRDMFCISMMYLMSIGERERESILINGYLNIEMIMVYCTSDVNKVQLFNVYMYM